MSSMTKIVVGVEIPLSAEEEVEFNARQAAYEAEQANYVPPDPAPRLVASANFTVVDGLVENVGVASCLPAGCAIDTGTYWVFFSEPQPDISYIVIPNCSEGRVNVSGRFADYFEICVRSDGGALVDPSEFSVSIVRTQ